jgi:hypothetical protein
LSGGRRLTDKTGRGEFIGITILEINLIYVFCSDEK